MKGGRSFCWRNGLWLLLLLAAPAESRSSILSDYIGDWSYAEEWRSSDDQSTLSYSVATKRMAEGTIYAIGRQSVRGKQIKAYEEWLYADGRARNVVYNSGRTDRVYTGTWSVKSGAIVFDYKLVSDKREWFRGSLKRVTRDRWTGTGTASGGYSYTMLQQRAGSSSITRWLFGNKATIAIPKDYLWFAGEFDLGDNDRVPSYEFYPRRSGLASNSYGTLIFVSGKSAAMDLAAYVRKEVKPWFKQRGHKLVQGSEKTTGGQSWVAETTYMENGINYRERWVVWPCRDGFVAGTVFGPVSDWSKREFTQMLRVLETLRIRQKR